MLLCARMPSHMKSAFNLLGYWAATGCRSNEFGWVVHRSAWPGRELFVLSSHLLVMGRESRI